MQLSQTKQTIAALISGVVFTTFVAGANAGTVTVNDVTDWSTTPNQVVTLDTPYIPYDGGVYAGVNTLDVISGANSTIYSGFCIDPYHYSESSEAGYSIDPLTSGIVPKAPGTLNAFTAGEIEDLWAEYFSANMTSAAAAGLQIAIWELVSSNAVATHEISAADAISFPNGGTTVATADLASLAGYSGPQATLEALTGPGQDYVIDIPGFTHTGSAPDNGSTFVLLALSLGALTLAKPRHA